MRAALLDGTTVANVIEYDPESDYDPSPLTLVVLDETTPIGPGWSYVGGVFTAPTPEAIPDSRTRPTHP